MKRIDDFLLENGWTDASDEVYSFVQYYRDPETGEIQEVGYASEIAASRYLVARGWIFTWNVNQEWIRGYYWGWKHPRPDLVEKHGLMQIELAFEFAQNEARMPIIIDSEEKLIEHFGQPLTTDEQAEEVKRLSAKWLQLVMTDPMQEVKIVRAKIK